MVIEKSNYYAGVDKAEGGIVILLGCVLNETTGILNTVPKDYFYNNSGMMFAKEGKLRSRGFGIVKAEDPKVNELDDLEAFYMIYAQVEYEKAEEYIEEIIVPVLAKFWKETFDIANGVDRTVEEIFSNRTKKQQ